MLVVTTNTVAVRSMAVSFPLLVALCASCSGNNRVGDEDASTTDTDTDSDSATDTATETATDTLTDTESHPNGWHWDQLPSEIEWGMLLDVSGSSLDDVIAVGRLDLPLGDDRQSLLFDGDFWTLDTFQFEALFLDMICASGDGTYYAASIDLNPEFSVFARDGGSWQGIDAPDLAPCTDAWFPGNFEAAGYLSCLSEAGLVILYACGSPGPVSEPYYLSAYDGSTWTSVLGPDTLPDAEVNVHLVWGAAIDDLSLFAIEDPSSPGYHFDGELTPMSAPPWPVCEGTYGCVFGMDGDLEHGYGFYAVGRGSPEEGLETKGFVWHSNNAINWTEIEVPHPADPETYSESFLDVWISDQGEIIVVGKRSNYDPENSSNVFPFPLLLWFDGEQWQEVEIPPHPESTDGMGGLYRIWGTGGEAFAVGSLQWNDTLSHPAVLHLVPE